MGMQESVVVYHFLTGQSFNSQNAQNHATIALSLELSHADIHFIKRYETKVVYHVLYGQLVNV